MTRKSKFILPLLILGIIGFADASFLTIEKLSTGTVPCVVTKGCDQVTNSPYAEIAGVPISMYGVAYYLAIILLSIQALTSDRAAWAKRLAWLTVVGFLFSLYLLYVMQFVIGAYCFYCLISAGTSIALFITGMIVLKRYQQPKPNGSIPNTV